MGNAVFNYNPAVADINITTHGSDWYWAVTAFMGFSTIAFSLLAFRIPRTLRIFHYLTIATVAIGTIAYYTMASDLGSTPVRVEFQRSDSKVSGNTRQIFYVRYILYFLAFPLVLLNLLLTSTTHWSTILFTIFLQETAVISGLVGALIPSGYKWGYYLFAIFAFFAVAFNLIFSRKAALTVGSDVARHYTLTSIFALTIWLLYPIAWGVSEGGNVIAPDSEAAFYGVLDVLLLPVLGFFFLWGHRNIDPARLGFNGPRAPTANSVKEPKV